MALGFPLLMGEMAERGQIAVIPPADSLQLVQGLVDLRALQKERNKPLPYRYKKSPWRLRTRGMNVISESDFSD